MLFLGLAILGVQALAWALAVGAPELAGPERRAARTVFHLLAATQVVAVAGMSWIPETALVERIAVGLPLLVVAFVALGNSMRLQRDHASRQQDQLEGRIILRRICHETCTPLAALSGYAEMLVNTQMGAASRKSLLRKIHRISLRLADLVRDLLEVTKRTGSLPIEVDDVEVDALVADLILLADAEAGRRDLDLSAEFGEGVPSRVSSDGRLLRLALGHLVGNAVENTVRGRVTIRVEFGGNSIRFTVVDDGSGIALGDLERIRRDQSASSVGGLGLGLPLCRRVAAALDGRFDLESEPGHGTRAVLEVPCNPARERACLSPVGRLDLEAWLAERDAGDSLALDGSRILLVEDGPENREYIRHFLQRAGAEVDTAAHGRDGLEVLALGPDRYDIVLMDLDMPIMDGFAATASARARGYEVPIVALSAHSLDDDRAKSLELGCDDFLAKPVSAQRLVATCARHRGGVRGAAPPPPAPKPRARDATAPAPPRSKWADDPEYADLLEAYHRSMSGIWNDLEAARAAADLPRARTLAHRLKGSAGQYGYPDLGQAAAACERLILEGRSIEEIETELTALLAEVARVAQNA